MTIMKLKGIPAILLTLALTASAMTACASGPEPEIIQSESSVAEGTGVESSAPVKPMARGKDRDMLSKLVEDGVISQETYDKMKAYMEENLKERRDQIKAHTDAISPEPPEQPGDGKRLSLLDRLLEDGIITQAEYDALKAAMQNPEKLKPEAPSTGDGATRDNPFSRFVSEGIISEQTAAAIKEYMQSNGAGFAAKPEIAKPAGPDDLMKEMLEAGVITQSEYDAIKAALPEWTGGRTGDRTKDGKQDRAGNQASVSKGETA